MFVEVVMKFMLVVLLGGCSVVDVRDVVEGIFVVL